MLCLILLSLEMIPNAATTVVYNSNVGLNDKSAMMIPEDQVPSYRTGSICAFIAWISYILSVWAFKAALVFLYNRLT